jgi:hypothetical protein
VDFKFKSKYGLEKYLTLIGYIFVRSSHMNFVVIVFILFVFLELHLVVRDCRGRERMHGS